MKAKAKAELTQLETEKEVDLADEKKGTVEVNLSLEGNYVTISSDENEATVFVNGKKRGKLSNGSYKLGPVATDETIEVHLEKNTEVGTIKSESIKVGDQSTYYLKFPKETPSVKKYRAQQLVNLYEHIFMIMYVRFHQMILVLSQIIMIRADHLINRTVSIYNIYTKRNYRRLINNGSS